MAQPGVELDLNTQATDAKMDPKERFYRHFQTTVTALQEQIVQLESFSSIAGERQDAIDHVLAGISRLSNEVSDASDYVPAYDQRTYAQAIKALTDKLNETTDKVAPRSRFQFKPRSHSAAAANAGANDPRNIASVLLDSRSRPSGDATSQASEAVADGDAVGPLPSFPKNYNAELSRPGLAGVRKPSFSAARDIVISEHTGLHIILPSSASRATSSGRLTDLDRCIVDMSVPTGKTGAPFAGLHLRNIKKSLIVAGHVDGACHITGITDSILVVAARQVRIHECKNVDIYLHCTSHPIIEDSTGMRFAPLPGCYLPAEEDAEKNQWDQVDDFKWLKADHSPNWSVLPEQERVSEDIWTRTVPGEPLSTVEAILKTVGVSARQK